jgi:hypothetical protein
MPTATKGPKTQKVNVTLQVQVPTGTSKTKVEKTISTLLKSGSAPEGFKLGAPRVSGSCTYTGAASIKDK